MGKIAFVFPGQGTQHPGMGLDLKKNDLFARFTFIQADQLRPGTSDQCFYGDAETLKQTANTQPCLFTVEMAAAQALIGQGVTPDMVAGFSLGELAALTITGGVDFESGIKMVTHRGKLMQDAAEKVDSAMIAVMKLDTAKVEELCAAYPEAYPVNYNCPGQTVVAVKRESLEGLREAVKAAGGRAMPLKVSGGFHSPFMAEAAEQFNAYLQDVKFSRFKVPLYSNYTARPYDQDCRELLTKQICNPVRWQELVENMIADGADTFIELGPGDVLCGLIRRIDKSVRTYHVEDWDGLDSTAREVKKNA
ncbi:MAG: ACP S-malonyltransferase [Candidatus Onthomonas sp.]|nr:ACP S-malonyltransferase [Candidatus Onthomonas sp.]